MALSLQTDPHLDVLRSNLRSAGTRMQSQVVTELRKAELREASDPVNIEMVNALTRVGKIYGLELPAPAVKIDSINQALATRYSRTCSGFRIAHFLAYNGHTNDQNALLAFVQKDVELLGLGGRNDPLAAAVAWSTPRPLGPQLAVQFVANDPNRLKWKGHVEWCTLGATLTWASEEAVSGLVQIARRHYQTHHVNVLDFPREFGPSPKNTLHQSISEGGYDERARVEEQLGEYYKALGRA